MTDARAAFLTRLVDYAGLFPPASLTIGEAVAQYREARGGPHSWMLGRFLCPASRLGELVAAMEGDTAEVGVILDGPGRGGPWGPAMRDDLERVATYTGALAIATLEARLPAEAPVEAVGAAVPALAAVGLSGADVYLEVPLDVRFETLVPETVAAIADAGARAKVRCGGATLADFPSPTQLATFVVACRESGVPFKATAGLHHPFPQPDPATGASMHGFLNLGAAAVLAGSAGLDERAIHDLVSEEDPAMLSLDEAGVSWRGHTADAEAIAHARAEALVAFGSCSFSEPVLDLVTLGVLD